MGFRRARSSLRGVGLSRTLRLSAQVGVLGLGAALSPYEMASMTAENITALETIRLQQYVELAVVLLCVFGLHLADLALSQRKLFRAGSSP